MLAVAEIFCVYGRSKATIIIKINEKKVLLQPKALSEGNLRSETNLCACSILTLSTNLLFKMKV